VRMLTPSAPPFLSGMNNKAGSRSSGILIDALRYLHVPLVFLITNRPVRAKGFCSLRPRIDA
jgi:hypothetical protein